jgi:hypothetical protein
VHVCGALLTIEQECNAVAFMPDGKLIMSAWNDGKVRAFLPQSGHLKFEINNAHNKVREINSTHLPT